VTGDILTVAGMVFLIVIPAAWLAVTLAAITVDARDAGQILAGRDGEEARRELAGELAAAGPVRFTLARMARLLAAPWRVIVRSAFRGCPLRLPPRRRGLKRRRRNMSGPGRPIRDVAAAAGNRVDPPLLSEPPDGLAGGVAARAGRALDFPLRREHLARPEFPCLDRGDDRGGDLPVLGDLASVGENGELHPGKVVRRAPPGAAGYVPVRTGTCLSPHRYAHFGVTVASVL
jgi:hypothetical protein